MYFIVAYTGCLIVYNTFTAYSRGRIKILIRKCSDCNNFLNYKLTLVAYKLKTILFL